MFNVLLISSTGLKQQGYGPLYPLAGMDLGGQFNVEYRGLLLVFKVSAEAEGSLEHRAFVVVGRALQAFQDATVLFSELGLLFFLLALEFGVTLLLMLISPEIFGRLTAFFNPLHLKFPELFH